MFCLAFRVVSFNLIANQMRSGRTSQMGRFLLDWWQRQGSQCTEI
jgi:hypothetical protein